MLNIALIVFTFSYCTSQGDKDRSNYNFIYTADRTSATWLVLIHSSSALHFQSMLDITPLTGLLAALHAAI